MERRDLPDLLWEQYADEVEMLKAELPEQAVNASQEIRVKTEALKSIRKELKLVKEIIEVEREYLPRQCQLWGKENGCGQSPYSL